MTRCAIYTRKSTDEGLDQDFNSLVAQRESAEAYIASQRWECLPDRYDDGGFTGGNMERPALRRLMEDIQAGKIDCVIVYKVDRLSRSLLDFSRIIETFDAHSVAFVSVTQAFDTSSSMGRLTLNVLLSFAQFEREMISERTRDKMGAARRKGKYIGGAPILGYDVERPPGRLVINDREATRVRQVFELYLQHRALLATVAELDRRGWKTKCWTTKKGIQRGGRPFTKTSLYGLLTSPTYIGQVRYKGNIYPGEHEPIVDDETFEKVQTLLVSNRYTGGSRNRQDSLLKGILRCKSCNCSMAHTYTGKRQRRYRYYVCTNAQKRGWKNCPAPSVPAPEIERFVIDQIREVVADQGFVEATLNEVRNQAAEQLAALENERKAVERDLQSLNTELRDASDPNRLAELHDRIGAAERRLSAIHDEEQRLHAEFVDKQVVAAALREFDGVWVAMTSAEQARVVELLLEKVEYDGESLSVRYRPTGFRALAEDLQEDAA